MLVLLPPSETKHPGGRGRPLDLTRLALAALTPERNRMVDALVALAADEDASARVLKLSERQRGDIAHNAALRTGPTMPAVDRYTGVLFDALDAASLDASGRRWLGGHVLIQSAPFGPVGALDPIPAYRLGAGTSVPGVPALRRLWAEGVESALAAQSPRFVLDLRSEAYAALGPIPAGVPSVFLRVVTAAENGTTRALNHFNKHAKGELVRRLASSRPRIGTVAALRAWAEACRFDLRDSASHRPGELDLVV